jgi:hypothetical protein
MPSDAAPDPFIAGVRDGTRVCAVAAENTVQAALAFIRGEYVETQRLLGIAHSDIATLFLDAIVEEFKVPIVGEPSLPYANGYRIARRICTYGLILSKPKGKGPGKPAPAAKVRESAGADVWNGEYHIDPHSGTRFRVMGRSRVPRSHATSTFANKGESLAYHEALNHRGEVGLQSPAGANLKGPDFITAVVDPKTQLVEIIITDVKSSLRGVFPSRAPMPVSWYAELLDTLSPDRLSLGDAALEQAIRDAVQHRRIRHRRLHVDFSPTGQGTVTGF